MVWSSDDGARYRPFGNYSRDHTVDMRPMGMENSNQSPLVSSRYSLTNDADARVHATAGIGKVLEDDVLKMMDSSRGFA
jgi:hypothetical protein